MLDTMGDTGMGKIWVWAGFKEFAIEERERTLGTWHLVGAQ